MHCGPNAGLPSPNSTPSSNPSSLTCSATPPQIRMGGPKSPLVRTHPKSVAGATPLGGKASYKKDGIALIRSMNVRDGHFSQDGLAFIDDRQAARLAGVVVKPDDVLLNITGASVARVCRAPCHILPARVNQHVAIIRPTRGFDPRFLARISHQRNNNRSVYQQIFGFLSTGTARVR